jgi:hypothetical protein
MNDGAADIIDSAASVATSGAGRRRRALMLRERATAAVAVRCWGQNRPEIELIRPFFSSGSASSKARLTLFALEPMRVW